jgi:DNA-binding MarR family transcriptional regulator
MRNGKAQPLAAGDSFDRTIAAWKAVVPELDTDTFAIFGRIHLLSRHWFDALERFGDRYGIGPGEVYVLLALRRTREPLTPTELYQQLSITSGTITKRVDRLVAAGLAERFDAESDARSVRVGLTRAGRRAIDDGLVFSKAHPLRAIGSLAKVDRRKLIDLLRLLLSEVEASAES